MQRNGVTVRGLQETVRNLRGLRRKAFEEIAETFLAPVAEPVVARARRNLETAGAVDTGMLARSIGVVVRVYPNAKWMAAYVGPRSGFAFTTETGSKHDPVKYAHLVEFGTKPHSLQNRVDMKSIRKGTTVFARLAQKDMDDKGIYYRRDKIELARKYAREYLLRRDRNAGRRTHPGTAPKPFMRPTWDDMKQGLMDTFKEEIGPMIEMIAARVSAIPEQIRKNGVRVMSSLGKEFRGGEKAEASAAKESRLQFLRGGL